MGVPLLHALFRAEVRGRDKVPAAPFVLVANHLNWLDSFLILAAMPAEPRVHFLADAELLRKRRLQWWIVRRAAGYIEVIRGRRGAGSALALMNECLQKGAILAIYPEGAYGTTEAQLLPFRRGFAYAATTADVAVVPAAVSGTKDLWLRKRVAITFGSPISGISDVNALVEASQSAVRSLLPPYREAPGPKLLRRRLTHLF